MLIVTKNFEIIKQQVRSEQTNLFGFKSLVEISTKTKLQNLKHLLFYCEKYAATTTGNIQ